MIVEGLRSGASAVEGSIDYAAVSSATQILGDRWSLLVVRELFVGNTRFSQIHEGLPGLSRSLLASRLSYLVRVGVVERLPPEGLDRRAKHSYVLTDAGRGLGPVLAALGGWATRCIAARDPVDEARHLAARGRDCESVQIWD